MSIDKWRGIITTDVCDLQRRVAALEKLHDDDSELWQSIHDVEDWCAQLEMRVPESQVGARQEAVAAGSRTSPPPTADKAAPAAASAREDKCECFVCTGETLGEECVGCRHSTKCEREDPCCRCYYSPTLGKMTSYEQQASRAGANSEQTPAAASALCECGHGADEHRQHFLHRGLCFQCEAGDKCCTTFRPAKPASEKEAETWWPGLTCKCKCERCSSSPPGEGCIEHGHRVGMCSGCVDDMRRALLAELREKVDGIPKMWLCAGFDAVKFSDVVAILDESAK